MSENVLLFLTERKNMWLKNKITPPLGVDEIAELNNEADIKFSLNVWLPDAAKRAGQLSMVSHPSKFSHPSAKTSSIIVNGTPDNDGYLRTGNVAYALDVFGNAAALDVYKFLTIKMSDGQTVLEHLERDSEIIQSLFNIESMDYADLKQGFIKIKQSDVTSVTDSRVKQIYFPVEQDYHLLSILTPSGLLATLKSRVDSIRFSEQTKAAKENLRKNEFDVLGYDDLFNLTVVGYGGTQPQNISVLNSQNAGRAYLLQSIPPVLEKRHIRLPRYDFFKNSLWMREYKESFQSLHKLAMASINNVHIRQAIENIIKYIVDQVLFKALSIRALEPDWTLDEYYQALPLYQKIWLDNARADERETNETWLNDLTQALARWLFKGYEDCLKQDAITFADGELLHVRSMIENLIQQDKELLK